MKKILKILYLRDAKKYYGQGLAYATEGSAGLDLRACLDYTKNLLQYH